MYLLGGCNAGIPPGSCTTLNGNSEYLLAYNNYNGTPAGYTNTSAITSASVGASSVIYNGYIYFAGGCTATACNGSTVRTQVDYAPINDDGTIGTWATTSSMGTNRSFSSLLQTTVTCMLLADPQTAHLTPVPNTLLLMPMARLAPGQPIHRSPTGLGGIDGVIFNGYVYVTGGKGNGAVGYVSTVYYSQINTATGALGTWTTGAAFTGGRNNHTALAYNSALYILGGFDGTNYLADVQYAKINADGSIGSWNYTANLPQGLQMSSGFAANGYLYLISGATGASACSAATYVASIHANTTIANGNNPTGLGGWSQTSVVIGSARYGSASAYDGGKAYVLGGACGTTMVPSGATQNYYSTIQSQPQVAKYSYYIDANNDVFPSKSSITVSTTAPVPAGSCSIAPL